MSKASVLALDVSIAHTGWCHTMLPDVHYIHGTINTDIDDYRTCSRFDRYDYVLRNILALCKKYKADTVLIEGYSHASHGNATLSLAELGGMLRSELRKLHIDTREIAAMSYRKIATGHGTIKPKAEYKPKRIVCGKKVRAETVKDAVREYIHRYLGRDIDDDNEADALLLAYAYATHTAEVRAVSKVV
jgi:Holliday junction resolvasome RuvABC endonuclease subunit